MVAGSRPKVHWNPSGFAVRTSSVFLSHLSLRTSFSAAPGLYSDTLYGPEAIGLLSSSLPAPWPFGTGVNVFCATTLPKSANGFFRWNTIVFSSGVSIVGRSPDLYGPWYDAGASISCFAYGEPMPTSGSQARETPELHVGDW